MALEGAQDPPPPVVIAGYPGWCSQGGDPIDEGDEIQADGAGGWAHPDCNDDEAASGYDPAERRQPPPATTTDEMGY